MPRYRNKGDVNVEELVQELETELKQNAQAPPEDPFLAAGGKPVIFETPTGLGSRYRVTVVWDKWGSLGVEERNRIIMEAYRRVLGPEAGNVSLTLGVTRTQFNSMSMGLAYGA